MCGNCYISETEIVDVSWTKVEGEKYLRSEVFMQINITNLNCWGINWEIPDRGNRYRVKECCLSEI